MFDNFLDAIVEAHSGMDVTLTWPAHPAQIEAGISDLIAMRVFEKYLQDKNKFFKGLRDIPTDSIRTYLYQAGLVGLKVARVLPYLGHKITVDESVKFILDLVKSTQERVYNDPLCGDGKNLIYSDKEVYMMIGNKFVSDLSDKDKRKIAGLNIAAESLSWAMFYDMYRSGGFVISGPYETKQGRVIIRENINLKPGFSTIHSKYEWLREVLLYEKEIEVRCDFANHFVYQKPILTKLKGFRIETDRGVVGSINEIVDLTEYLEDLRKQYVSYVEDLSPSEIISRGAEICSYLFKGLWDYYSEEWKPGRKFSERIQKDGMKYWHKYENEREEQPTSYYRHLYDLRNDFLG